MPDAERPGQLRNGFHILARDLDRAVAVAGFGDLHMLLIEQARERSYDSAKRAGLDDPLPFTINLSALARDTGKSRAWLTVRFGDLVRYRVFLPLDAGGYLINKDYRQWVHDDGTPRLSRCQIAWCKETRSPVSPLIQSKRVACITPDTPPVSPLIQAPVSPLIQATQTPNGPPPDPPCESTAHPPGTGTGVPARGIESSERGREKKKPLFFSPSGSEKKPDAPDPRETFRERDARLVREHTAEMKRIMQDPEFYKPRFPPPPLENNNGSTH